VRARDADAKTAVGRKVLPLEGPEDGIADNGRRFRNVGSSGLFQGGARGNHQVDRSGVPAMQVDDGLPRHLEQGVADVDDDAYSPGQRVVDSGGSGSIPDVNRPFGMEFRNRRAAPSRESLTSASKPSDVSLLALLDTSRYAPSSNT